MVTEVCEEHSTKMRRRVYQTLTSIFFSFSERIEISGTEMKEGGVNLGLQKLIQGTGRGGTEKVPAKEQVKFEVRTQETNKLLEV
jgi:hypothetical protein